VIFGAAGAAHTADPGTLIVDMSSIDPKATRALAARADSLGLRWVDCPLSGGAGKALSGNLTLMAGGTAQDVGDTRRILAALHANLTHMGPVGAGQTTKLINQVLCGIGFVAVAEATRIAMDAGVDPLMLPQALRGGRADSAILQEYMPRFARPDAIRTGRIDNMVKDLAAAFALAHETATPTPITEISAVIHRRLSEQGLGAEDEIALMQFFTGPDSRPE